MTSFRKILLSLYMALFAVTATAAQSMTDTTKYLLLDKALQFEITDAVDNMYNFNFHKAEVEFDWIRYNHRDHPLPYFLFGISTWWQMMPNLDKDSPLGDEFLAYMDTAVVKAKKMFKEDETNVEAAFFLAGAYGFKGRYHSEKRNWGKAAGAGKQALKYLDKTKGNESFSPEILFGDALFNYYSIWIREQYPSLRPILFFFKKGDKELGIEQLETVSRNAFYTRVEAIYFLMRIKAFEQKKTFDALRMAEYIYNQYPDNPYFHRFYARMLYTAGQYPKTEEVSNEILARIENGQEGYEEVSGRYASFYLGHINRVRGNWPTAEKHYNQAIKFTDNIDDKESGYYLYSHLYLAKKEVEDSNYQSALDRIEIIRDNSKRKSPVNKSARALKKEIRKKR